MLLPFFTTLSLSLNSAPSLYNCTILSPSLSHTYSALLLTTFSSLAVKVHTFTYQRSSQSAPTLTKPHNITCELSHGDPTCLLLPPLCKQRRPRSCSLTQLHFHLDPIYRTTLTTHLVAITQSVYVTYTTTYFSATPGFLKQYQDSIIGILSQTYLESMRRTPFWPSLYLSIITHRKHRIWCVFSLHVIF